MELNQSIQLISPIPSLPNNLAIIIAINKGRSMIAMPLPICFRLSVGQGPISISICFVITAKKMTYGD